MTNQNLIETAREIIRREYWTTNLIDAKGRSVGMAVAVDKRITEVGNYYEVSAQMNKNGHTWGSGQSYKNITSDEELEKYLEKRYKGLKRGKGVVESEKPLDTNTLDWSERYGDWATRNGLFHISQGWDDEGNG